MKTININIDEIKRYPTVTNPIKADDLHTPQAYAYTLRRAIVTDCTTEQRAELVELLNGKDTAEGVTFNNTKANRNRLHRWQNEQSRKERAAILGEGWQYVDGLNHGTQPGDLVTCIDGTRGRVTKSNPGSCVIEFETENGQRLTVAGYFRYTPSAKSEAITEAEGIQIGDKVRHNKHEEVATVTAIREAFVNRCDGYRYLYTLDFGQSVKGPFGVELNGGEFLREAFTPCAPDSEADTLADIISEAKRQECRSVSGLNYGPIKYLRDRVLYADNGKTTAENMEEYENNLHRVTTPDDYAGYLLSQYDVFVDETKVFCDLRRVFPSLTFDELCRLIRDHMDDNQQGDGIAAALVPDCVILSSADEYTRRQFLARHDNFNRYRADGWNPEQLRKAYDRDSLAVHFLLSEELYYTWENDRAARCLESVREIYPDMTADELRNIRDKYADAVGEIYG